MSQVTLADFPLSIQENSTELAVGERAALGMC